MLPICITKILIAVRADRAKVVLVGCRANAVACISGLIRSQGGQAHVSDGWFDIFA
jgi:hypothetical protein